MFKDFSEKMGNKKLLNTSSSPPIPYKRYSNNCEEEKPLQQHHTSQQQQQQQQTENNRQSNNVNTTTCLLVKHNTNTMFTKLRNYFTNFRTTSSASASASASQKHYTQQKRKCHKHQHYRHEKLTECNSIPIVQSTSKMLNIVSIVVMLVFLASINGVTSSPLFVDNPSLAQFQSGRNIRHLPCIVRKSGRSGVCMFAIDCIKQNGTHLGTCIDRFYFGSCCDIQVEEISEIADNSIDQNTISHHFTSESSTLPTSALFKLTTLSPLQQHGNINVTNNISSSSNVSNISNSSTAIQQDVTQILNSVTQAFVSSTLSGTSGPTILASNLTTGKPTKPTTTTKPIKITTAPKLGQQTTHKQSQFVIRTTAKPTKYTIGAKPSHNTTTKKKTTPPTLISTSAKTTTTTKPPLLTTTAEATQQRDETPVEVTTTPTKLFTYQIVETTAYTPTEATNVFDFITTERLQHETTKPTQKTSSSPTDTTATKATTTKLKETTIRTTEATTTQKITTNKPKPQTSRKPTTTKKPTSIKRTTVKPTRRPITTTSTSTITTQNDLNTTRNSTAEAPSFATSTTSQVTTIDGNKTTLAPRPRPKPTASIIKVPKPTSTTTTTTTTSSTTTTTPRTTTEEEKIASTTSSTTTKKPAQTTQSTTMATATSATTPKTTATTTNKVTSRPVLTSTTHKPGLVTWTNIDGEPVDPNQPLISDWVPVTSVAPLNTHNKVEETPANVTYEEMDVSVSSSVSAVMNNATVIIVPPKKPILRPKPSTTTSSTPSTTSTAAPTTTTTLKPSTSTSAATEEPETTSTSESFLQFTTEGFSPSTTTSPSGFSTEEVATENLNLNSSTTSPFTGLEGIDYRQVCGRRMFPEPRIVGGSNAAFGRWPWQISLRQWRTSTYLHKCGAALLNENWAITAAHCVDNVPPSDLLLRLGEYDLAEEEEPYGYQERRVQIVASHPQFDPRTFEYDLALLRFYEPVVFQPNIIPVCVPGNDEDFIGQTAFVTGWGRLYEDGPLPSVLQEVAVPVINNTICESMYRAAGYIEHIPHIFICAGWKKGGYDSCEGDSGGPMVLQQESDKRFQLGGVISWGIGCAEANQPGVYTRISEFRDWINQILQF